MTGNITLLAALLLGLAASGHCLVMCGGISTALGLATARGANGRPRADFLVGYQIGRVLAYTLVALLRYMFADEHVTTDELYAIGATFTIGIWLFAYIYSICQTLVPDSFAAYGVDGGQRTWFELLFLSCTTMTSTGLSDVIPVKPHARSLVMIQQIAGMLYLAMVVARIVGLTFKRGRVAR